MIVLICRLFTVWLKGCERRRGPTSAPRIPRKAEIRCVNTITHIPNKRFFTHLDVVKSPTPYIDTNLSKHCACIVSVQPKQAIRYIIWGCNHMLFLFMGSILQLFFDHPKQHLQLFLQKQPHLKSYTLFSLLAKHYLILMNRI